MKKLYCLLLILMLVFTFGCAKSDDTTVPDTDGGTTVTPPADEETTTPPAADTPNSEAPTTPETKPEDGAATPKPPAETTPTPPVSKPGTPSTPKPSTPPQATTPPPASKPETKKLTAAEVAEKLKAKYPMSDTVALDESLLADFYAVDMGIIDSFSVEIPAASTQALELAVFKLKDAKDSAAVEKILSARKETLGKSFDGYVDDQAAMARAGVVSSKNGYVILAIGENASKIAELFAKTV